MTKTAVDETGSNLRRERLARLLNALMGVLLVGLSLGLDLLSGAAPGFGLVQATLLGAGLVCLLVAAVFARWNPPFLLLAVSSGLSIVLLELVLRLFFAPMFSVTYRLHPEYLHALVPGAHRVTTRLPANGGQRVRMVVNSQGYRGPELSRPRGGYRVVVYGDSFVESRFSERENSFPAQLRRRLSDALARPVEVINAGVAAYGPDQAYRRMRDELGTLRPDLVALTVFAGNDYGDLVRNQLFGLDEQLELLRRRPSVAPELERSLRDAGRSLTLVRALTRLQSSLLAELEVSDSDDRESPWRTVEESLTQSRREYAERSSGVVTNLFYDHYDADLSLEPESASARYKAGLMEAVVAAAHREMKEAGVPFLLVIVPDPIDICPDYDGGRVNRQRHPAYRTTTLTDTLAVAADRHGIPHVNLFPHFAAREPNKLYFDGGDNHWNDRGQSLAAEIVAAYVVEHQLLRAVSD